MLDGLAILVQPFELLGGVVPIDLIEVESGVGGQLAEGAGLKWASEGHIHKGTISFVVLEEPGEDQPMRLQRCAHHLTQRLCVGVWGKGCVERE